MINTQPKPKSRDLSNYQFLEILQTEWLVADLRAKIYFRHKDKEYWKKVKEGKRVKIEDISERNNLPSIFTDEGLRKDFEKKVYNLTSIPNFIYRNEEDRQEQEYYDLMYYFNKNSDVRIDFFGEIKVGKVLEYKPYFAAIKVQFDNGDKFDTTIDKVTRIL